MQDAPLVVCRFIGNVIEFFNSTLWQEVEQTSSLQQAMLDLYPMSVVCIELAASGNGIGRRDPFCAPQHLSPDE